MLTWDHIPSNTIPFYEVFNFNLYYIIGAAFSVKCMAWEIALIFLTDEVWLKWNQCKNYENKKSRLSKIRVINHYAYIFFRHNFSLYGRDGTKCPTIGWNVHSIYFRSLKAVPCRRYLNTNFPPIFTSLWLAVTTPAFFSLLQTRPCRSHVSCIVLMPVTRVLWMFRCPPQYYDCIK